MITSDTIREELGDKFVDEELSASLKAIQRACHLISEQRGMVPAQVMGLLMSAAHNIEEVRLMCKMASFRFRPTEDEGARATTCPTAR